MPHVWSYQISHHALSLSFGTYVEKKQVLEVAFINSKHKNIRLAKMELVKDKKANFVEESRHMYGCPVILPIRQFGKLLCIWNSSQP